MKPELTADIDFEAGYVLPVDKPLGWTSSDIVRKIKVLLRRRGLRKIKVGHAGTLDPLASGVLIVCIGRATKQAETLQAQPKEYVATVALGATTPSYDLEHPIDQRYSFEHITRGMVEEAVAGMVGEQLQVPPVYSAKMIDGKRAYEYARGGKEVPMRQALIHIYSIMVEKMEFPTGLEPGRTADAVSEAEPRVSGIATDNVTSSGSAEVPEVSCENRGERVGHRALSDGQVLTIDESLPRVTLRIVCSKGTYIRSMARDLGEKLGSGGHLVALRRTGSGNFSSENCYTPEEIEAAWSL